MIDDKSDWLGPEDLQHSFEVEPLVHEFVRSIDGEVVSDLLPDSPNFENADYLFQTDGVIAELKCLQADFAAPAVIQEKVSRLYRKWLYEGSITFEMIWRPNELPREKRRKIKALYYSPLQNIIKKANRQLRETAKYLEMEDAQKLLLIANDGLYSMEPLPIIGYTVDILQRRLYSNIHGFVYFMVNSYVNIPGDDYARQLWIPSYDDRAPNDLPDFVDRLGNQWFDFFGQKIGGWNDSIKTNALERVLNARHVPFPNQEAI